MDLRETIIVNDVLIILQPYTELRFEQLQTVEEEINEYAKAEENKNINFENMPREKKAEFWMKKAKILWLPKPKFDADGRPNNVPGKYWNKDEKFFTKAFFEDKNFEYPLLRKSQDFFLMTDVYL